MGRAEEPAEGLAREWVAAWSAGLARRLVIGLTLAMGHGPLLAGCDAHRHGEAPAEVYQHHCRRCHGSDGSSEWASEVAGRRVDLRDPDFQRNTSDEEIRRIVAEGFEEMQPVVLPPAEMDSVLVQLRRLGRGGG